MTEKVLSIALVVVGWIAFGFAQFIEDPFVKLFLLAAVRVLP